LIPSTREREREREREKEREIGEFDFNILYLNQYIQNVIISKDNIKF
jgi:hypothetical protein